MNDESELTVMQRAIQIEQHLHEQTNGNFSRLPKEAVAMAIAVLQLYKQQSILVNIGLGKDKSLWRKEHDQADEVINRMLEYVGSD